MNVRVFATSLLHTKSIVSSCRSINCAQSWTRWYSAAVLHGRHLCGTKSKRGPTATYTQPKVGQSARDKSRTADVSDTKSLTMRFVQFLKDGNQCIGLQQQPTGDIFNLSSADPQFPTDMRTFIEGGSALVEAAKRASDKMVPSIPLASVKLLAPVTSCDKVLCIGMNYIDHCEEQNAPVPVEPVIFNKFPSCIIAPHAELPFPAETECLDWEVELVIVVGKEAKNVKESEAMDYVFGYTVANDLSARDWQLTPGKNGGQWVIGKAMDGFCPLGPAIVTKEGLSDPHNLGLRTRVNGVTKQDSNTSNLVHSTQKIITFITRFMTLKPGDLILTGTPPGVGCFRKPPEYMKKGDVVEVEIDEIGTVTTTIV